MHFVGLNITVVLPPAAGRCSCSPLFHDFFLLLTFSIILRSLYDQGSINSANSRSFRDSNYNNRSTKGRGSIKRLSGKRTTSFACYKRVGSELLEEDDVTSSLRGRN